MATCQKCGGEIQGWTCQGCGQVFRENDAGALVFDAMEAVAWRLRRVDVERWNLWDLDPRVDTPAYADASKWTVQALAVIPTEGLGSSAAPIPTCDAETAVVGDKR